MTAKPNADDKRIQDLRAHAHQTEGPDGSVWVYICAEAWQKAQEDHECNGPFPVLHDCGTRIWYMEQLPDGAVAVGDGKCNGYNSHGTRIVSVPVEWCHFMNGDEANCWFQAREVDDQLLGYAR